MIRALIFDFDGLILDTEEPIFLAWQEIYQEFGCELKFDTWAAIIGTAAYAFNPITNLENLVEQELPREEIHQRQRQREMELISERSIEPGVVGYLRDAKKMGLKIGLASSSTCQWVTDHLSRLGLLDYFDCIMASDDVERTKPDPELYLGVMKELEVSADQAVVFEDSPNGILAAKRAGLFCVAVPNVLTFQLSLDQADLCLDSLADIPLKELLQKVDNTL